MGSPSAIVTLGFGNGTFVGSPSLVVTLGFGIGEEPEIPPTVYLVVNATDSLTHIVTSSIRGDDN